MRGYLVCPRFGTLSLLEPTGVKYDTRSIAAEVGTQYAAVTQQLDDLYGAGNSDVDVASGYGGSRLITTAAVTLTTIMTATMDLLLRLFAAEDK